MIAQAAIDHDLSNPTRRQRDVEAEANLDIGQDLDPLTARKLEIVRLVAKGFSNKEVGQILDISHWTVAAHLKSTFLKLGIRRRGELAYAMRAAI